MTTTIWSTKYALTGGVTKEDDVEISDGYAFRDVGNFHGGNYLYLKIGKDAWLSKEEAIERSIELARRKVAAIENQKKILERRISSWMSETK